MNKSINNNQLIIGIDPHVDSLGIVFLHNNTIIKGFSMPNCSMSHFHSLISDVSNTAKSISANPVFVIESTNVFWRPLFSFLIRNDFLVYTVNSFQTNSSRKTRMRKTKTDLIDAKTVAELYLQGKAHQTKFPPELLFDLRELTRFYFWLSDFKGRILNRIYGYLFQIFPELSAVLPKKYFSKTLSLLIRRKLIHPSTLSKMNPVELFDIIRRVSRNKHSYKTQQFISLAAKSTGIPEGKYAFSNILKVLVNLYRFIELTLDKIELNHIHLLLRSVPNKLNTIKGFSSISQASFLSELGHHSWFQNADDVLAFFGLDPAISQSGRRKGQGKHISKAGTKFGRETMFLAATTCIFHNPVIKEKYRKLRNKGRKYIDAKCIIAADLTKICYAMLRDNSEFNPSNLI